MIIEGVKVIVDEFDAFVDAGIMEQGLVKNLFGKIPV